MLSSLFHCRRLATTIFGAPLEILICWRTLESCRSAFRRKCRNQNCLGLSLRVGGGALEKGYVYASTFFSPGERMVFKVLAEEDGVSMIRLVPTFMELAYRPHGVEPLLFAKKRLLVLSRMADPEEPPRRGELVGLNYIAAAIAMASEGGRALYVTAPQGGGNQVVYGDHPVPPLRGDDLLAAPSRGCKKGDLCNQ